MLLAIGFIVLSIIILYFGAEFALEGSEVIGKKLGLSPLVIGMILVGLGTSLPELFVAHIAAFQGKFEMAAGALVGSNIANMLLVLGLAAFITSMSLDTKEIRSQVKVHFALCLALIVLLKYGEFSWLAMVLLLVLCVIYMKLIVEDIKQEQSKEQNIIVSKLIILKVFLGFFMLYAGGELLVKGGVDLCKELEISEYIVSSLLLAFGTSFPELVTVMLSALKKKDTDLIVGNIIGSNMFNCALILGSLAPYGFKLEGDFFYESMALFLGGGFLYLLSYKKISMSRKSGALFVGIYGMMVLSWLGFFSTYH